MLFSVDAVPVILLHGTTPMYRDITLDVQISITSPLKGQLTALAEPGAVIESGDTLFEVDGEPVTLLQGTVPAYRDIGLAQVETAVAAGTGGLITWLPDEGDLIEYGDVAYEIDDEPVILFYGDTPATRALTEGVVGEDVAQLQQGLIDLGYASSDVFDVDGVFTAETTDLVVDWQADAGMTVDGVVDMGEVVFLAGPAEVVELLLSVDDGVVPGREVMGVSVSTPIRGDDVRQLEEALIDLGYADADDFDADGLFTLETAEVVASWQEDIGVTIDGIVDLGEVVFGDGPLEVSQAQARVGDLIGDTPILVVVAETGMSGPDVRQLEEALVDLGYTAEGSLVADGVMSTETVDAIIAWQTATGQDIDGIVNIGDVVFVDGDVRVSNVAISLGASINPGTPVLHLTGNEVLVTVELPAEEQGLLSVDDPVTVEMPDRTRTPGTVTSVASVATITSDGRTIIEVEITLGDPAAAGGLDEAPVEVDVITDSVSDVIAVPVTALLALREGGYAVEVDNGGGTTLIAVEPGFFADGLVELIDTDLEPGSRVVVP